MNVPVDILKKNGLSITGSRMQILELFCSKTGALAHADIEKETDAAYDRATVYRTLQTFVDKGILHQVPTTDNGVLYALCKHDCAQGHHHDNHVHFICKACEKTFCLDDVIVPEVKLPKGFTPSDAAMMVNGICGDCKR